ncbi:hypothetical protein SAMN05421858_1801 [Haladaptatus litoreus]|uniref:Uncharacterized protein n=1 Tax=Haladaptatus litoreus TaxID=553468 RepID=A0A1N6YZS4_9EURY|nr:hypothetical protein [Haladaptatus litoreus]SIR20025.1 hypothetical protein SAMN05421858_1801 [Haladaptatus litoreus]
MAQNTERVVREEFGRTAIWLFFSLLGWSLIIQYTPDFEPQLMNYIGIVIATAIAMSIVVVVIRLVTGEELKGGTESKDLILITTSFIVSFYLFWTSLTETWTIVTTALVAVLVTTVAVRLFFPGVVGIGSKS